jgi:hypothetical protein
MRHYGSTLDDARRNKNHKDMIGIIISDDIIWDHWSLKTKTYRKVKTSMKHWIIICDVESDIFNDRDWNTGEGKLGEWRFWVSDTKDHHPAILFCVDLLQVSQTKEPGEAADFQRHEKRLL